MTPQDVTLMTSLWNFLEVYGGWPFAIFFFIIIIGPWIFASLLMRSFAKRNDDTTRMSEKRFEEVVRMYESNVRLVEQYEKTSKDLKDVVMINTETFSRLTEAIKHNQFCPIVRRDAGTS